MVDEQVQSHFPPRYPVDVGDGAKNFQSYTMTRALARSWR